MLPEHKKLLRNLKTTAILNKNPSFPAKYISPKPYDDKTANQLTRAIIDYINFTGDHAERTSNEGRYIRAKTFVDSIGRAHVTPGKWIKSSGKKGTSDIKSTKRGRFVAIEVKTGKDRLSKEQKEYRETIQKTGGIYIVCKSFENFIDQWQKI